MTETPLEISKISSGERGPWRIEGSPRAQLRMAGRAPGWSMPGCGAAPDRSQLPQWSIGLLPPENSDAACCRPLRMEAAYEEAQH